MPDSLSFSIIEHVATLSTSKSNWSTELNVVKWGENNPKFDLRSWSPDHQKMGKGVTLTPQELSALKQALNSRSDI